MPDPKYAELTNAQKNEIANNTPFTEEGGSTLFGRKSVPDVVGADLGKYNNKGLLKRVMNKGGIPTYKTTSNFTGGPSRAKDMQNALRKVNKSGINIEWNK
jgi:hypothetical protein